MDAKMLHTQKKCHLYWFYSGAKLLSNQHWQTKSQAYLGRPALSQIIQ